MGTLKKRALLAAIPLLLTVSGIVIVLASSYAALTHQRYVHANGTAGDLLPGHAVGQSFVARYSDLSGVELRIGANRPGPGPARASLTLHLFTSPPQNSKSAILNPQSEIRTATLSAGTSLDTNPWYLFSFPSIADSENKTYYVELESPDAKGGEALTLFWWQPATPGSSDPYRDGMAYRDGAPQPGDLSIGISYSPSPIEVWAQMLRAASANFPLPIMLAALFLALAAAIWAAFRLPAILSDPRKRRQWLARWSLPTVLVIALVNGAIYLLAVPPWQGPDEHAHFGYAALLDKYNLDVDRVRHLQPGEYSELSNAVDASMDRNDFTRRVAWHSAPGAPADGGRSLLWEEEQPPTYYWLSAIALRTLRGLGVQVDPTQDSDSALRVMRLVSLVLGLGVVALAWLAGVFLSPGGGKDSEESGNKRRENRAGWLRFFLPLTVTLLPMHAFVASTANNDILAELAVSALFVALVALLKWPTGVRGVSLAALSIALTFASAYTKDSALAAAVPLLALGLLVWLGMLITAGVSRWSSTQRHRRRRLSPFTIPAVMGALILAATLLLPTLAFQPGGTAIGWNSAYWPVERASRVETGTAHSGSYVLELGDPGKESVGQVLVPPVYHPALVVSYAGWARLAPDLDTGTSSDPVISATMATLTVAGGIGKAASATVSLPATGAWVPITGTARVAESAEQVALRLAATGGGGRPVQFDDLSATVTGAAGPWNDPIYAGQGLLNGSMEDDAHVLNPLFSRLLPFEARQIADALANPQPLDKGALWGYYAAQEYGSFWGNFGWVSIPLPSALYTLLGAVMLIALAGLVAADIRRRRWSPYEWVGLVSFGAVFAATLLGFARQMTLLADLGIAAYPQGRYLFVLIIPIVWLLLVGLQDVWSFASWVGGRLWRAQSLRGRTTPIEGSAAATVASVTVQNGSVQYAYWGAWLFLTALSVFSAYCLLSLILPYYYG